MTKDDAEATLDLDVDKRGQHDSWVFQEVSGFKCFTN